MSLRPIPLFMVTLVLLTLFPGCSYPKGGAAPSSSPGNSAPVIFANVTEQAGIHFQHTNGASGEFYYIEPMPAGCALFDYDNDGNLDIFLVQTGSSEPFAAVKNRPHCALYHSNGKGGFTEATSGSGLDKDLGYGMGVAVGDYDNDGFSDLFITAYGGNRLFRNEEGTGRFVDVTAKVGMDKLHSTGYATSAAFGDYDNDGRLDLYVCYYSPWSWKSDKKCASPQNLRDYCSPEVYETDRHQLFHNDGVRFTDVSVKAGISKEKGRGLAVAFVDYDDNGTQDIFVANDLSENMLWHNNGGQANRQKAIPAFENRALIAGVARDESGRRMAAMGIAVADYDRSGRESLFVTDFSNAPNSLFKNVGMGQFDNVSTTSGVGPIHLRYLSFGCEFIDYDADTWPDIVTANGHVTVNIATQFPSIQYKEPNQLLHNEGNGTFREIEPRLLGDLAAPNVARGLAVGDYDNDGRVDVLVMRQNDPPLLLQNQDRTPHHWISFKTVGIKSNRDGRHTRFVVTAGGQRLMGRVRAGSSYLSHSDSRVYFGLGTEQMIEKVEISWPSGTRDILLNIVPDKFYTVTEGRGITHQAAGRDRVEDPKK